MTAVLFDSVNADTFPTKGFDATAGYVNGKYQSSAPLRAKFPYLPHITISVFASGDARCLDVEPGDATIDEVPAWLDRQYALGNRLPIVYTGASGVNALRAATGSRRYLVWSAHWTYSSHICAPGVCGYPQADATQWSDPVVGGPSVDKTLMSDQFFQAIGGDMATTLTPDDIAAVAKATADELLNRSFDKQPVDKYKGDDTSLKNLVEWSPNTFDGLAARIAALEAKPDAPSVDDIVAAVKGLDFKAV